MTLVKFGGAKMKIKQLMPLLLIMTLVFGTVTVTALDSKAMTSNNKLRTFANRKMLSVNDKIQPVDTEELKEKIPEKEVVEAELEAISIPRRFILWTYDGKSVMWGTYGNGYFRSEDNHGKYTWGIYGKGVIAGFYDGEFFWGRYRRGFWKADGLFGIKSRGRYVTFPSVYPVPIAKDFE